MEQFAQARWLLDPEVPVAERVSRTWGVRWEDSDQLRRFAEGARAPLLAESSHRLRSDLAEEAEQAGLAVRRNGTGAVNGVGVRRPSWTELLDVAFAFGTGYRLYSAVAHGTQWALVRVSGLVRDGWDENSDHLLVEEVALPGAVELALRHSLHAYALAAGDAYALFTQDHAQVRAAIAAWSDELGLPRGWLDEPMNNLQAE